MIRKTLIALAGCAAFTSANAVVIDFSPFGNGNTGLTELVTPEATFTSLGDNFFVGAAGVGFEICALNGGNCESDFTVDFNGLASNLMLTLFGFNAGDSVDFVAFGSGGGLLGSITASSNGLVDLSGLGAISSLLVDDNSTGAGFGYGEWTLDLDAVAVPAPGALALLGMGILGLGLGRRRNIA